MAENSRTLVERGIVPAKLPRWLKYPPLAKLVLPRTGLLEMVVIVVLFTALLSLTAQVKIPLPYTPVPITLQTLTVLVAGGLLGMFWGPFTVTTYILIGLLGAPVFAGGNGGVEYFVGATGGYLVGFLLAATVTGYISQRWGLNLVTSLVVALTGTLMIYVPGLLWLARFTGFEEVMAKGLTPFLVGDVLKLLVAGFGYYLLWSLRRQKNDGV